MSYRLKRHNGKVLPITNQMRSHKAPLSYSRNSSSYPGFKAVTTPCCLVRNLEQKLCL
jgi:hypothetical protein